jgi:hypothetical protein
MMKMQVRMFFSVCIFGLGLRAPGQTPTAPAPAPATPPAAPAPLTATCPPHLGTIAKSGLYRYIIGLSTSDSIWVDPMPDGTTRAWYWHIDKDAQGRVVRSASMHWRDESQSTKFYYAGDDKLPCRIEGYNQSGQMMGIDIPHRDASGNEVGDDEENPQGKKTGYGTRTSLSDRVEDMEYDITGRLVQHVTYFYGSSGRMTGRAIYPGGSTSTTVYLLQTVSEDDGLVPLTHQYRDGKLEFTMKYTFGPLGEMTHTETYTPDGYLAVTQEWDDGLVTDRTYHLRGGGTREYRYYTDNTRNPSRADVYVNGDLLCTEKYTQEAPLRFSTKVYGADGKLWAYYPPPAVGDLEKDGQPTGRNDGVIYREGPWW